MSANVGLSTPRGSGTSGYVQRNLSVLKPRAAGVGAPYAPLESRGPRHRKPDQEILNHDRMREIEVKVLELRDKLEEDEKLEDDEIEERCDELRSSLLKDMERGKGGAGGAGKTKRYQVHELAEAKIKESERLKRALGLRGNEVGGDDGDEQGDGGEHPMARQERRKRQREIERAAREESEREIELDRSRDKR